MQISPALKAFLDLIAWSEGTSSSPITQDRGYDVIVSGIDGQHRMVDYHDHPFADGTLPIVVNHAGLRSTASGRYQIILRIWQDYKQRLGLKDFSPDSQDAVAVELITERRAVDPIEAGDIQAAVLLCSGIWASLPGNNYGQGGKTLEALVDKYQELSA